MNHCYSTSSILILGISFVHCKQIQVRNSNSLCVSPFIDLILKAHFR